MGPDHPYRSPSRFWREYNELCLINAVGHRDTIATVNEPRVGPTSRLIREDRATGMRQLSGFGREYRYLRARGYRYDPVTKQMVPP